MKKLFLLLFLSLFVFSSTDVLAKEGKVISDRWYTMTQNGKKMGWYHIKHMKTDNKEAPHYFICDTSVEIQNRTMRMTNHIWAKDDQYFTATKIRLEWNMGGRQAILKGKVKEKGEKRTMDCVITMKMGGQERTKKEVRPFPQKAVIDLLTFEIVQKLPLDTKKVMNIAFFQLEELRTTPDHSIKYAGKKEVEMDGKKKSLHIFELYQSKRKKGEYFLNDKKELVKIIMDGSTVLTLTTKEKAKNKK